MSEINNNIEKKYKIAILASHPIQYQTPLFKKLNEIPEIDLTVFFCSNQGLRNYKDLGFGKEFKWDIPLLDGYEYEFLKNYSLCPNQSKFWGLINLSIIGELKKEKYDAIWIHGWNNCTNWIAMLTAFKLGIPVLLRGESNLLNKPSLWKKLPKRILLNWLFRRISIFLAIGKYNTEFYKYYSVSKDKIFLLPYSVNNDFFISKANELKDKKEILKEKYGISKNLPVILFCGKLIHVKRPKDLLKAYEMVLKHIDVALVFVGDGHLKNDLERYCRGNNLKNVFFTGFKNQTELPEFYAMADLFVLPSSLEPWGLVVNEAMCFNLPLIVSDKVGAGGDLVKDSINGYVYEEGNIYELEKNLRKLLLNKELLKSMGINSNSIIDTWSYKECLSGLRSAINLLVRI